MLYLLLDCSRNSVNILVLPADLSGYVIYLKKNKLSETLPLYGKALRSGADAFHAEAGNCLSWLKGSSVVEQLPGAIVLCMASAF